MLILICLFVPLATQAEETDKITDIYNAKPINLSKTDLSALKHTKSMRVDKIIDALTILMKDGTIVRMSDIDIPDFHIWDNAPLSDDAMRLLKHKLTERTEVMLYQTRNSKFGRTNRMGHTLGHIVTKDSGEWIQGSLIANGMARVYTAPKSDGLLKALYEAENTAQQAKRGLWGKDSPYRLFDANSLNDQNKGSFIVVEGTVQKAATVRNTIYLNFGKDWKTDFTVQVTPALRKAFSKKGINILSLAGQTLRVRGWLREYNGPLIELEDSAHLQILTPITDNSSLQNGVEPLNLSKDSTMNKIQAERTRGNNNYGSATE